MWPVVVLFIQLDSEDSSKLIYVSIVPFYCWVKFCGVCTTIRIAIHLPQNIGVVFIPYAILNEVVIDIHLQIFNKYLFIILGLHCPQLWHAGSSHRGLWAPL